MYAEQSLYLVHHGIKGQKWGVRRYRNEDGSLTQAGRNRYNENYTEKQRLQDLKMYGRGAEKRINRAMNEGLSVRGARSLEADRINRARRKATKSGQYAAIAGKAVGGTLGLIAPTLAKSLSYGYAVTHLGTPAGEVAGVLYRTLNDPVNNIFASAALSTGMAVMGETIAREGARTISMNARGYDRDKLRV